MEFTSVEREQVRSHAKTKSGLSEADDGMFGCLNLGCSDDQRVGRSTSEVRTFGFSDVRPFKRRTLGWSDVLAFNFLRWSNKFDNLLPNSFRNGFGKTMPNLGSGLIRHSFSGADAWTSESLVFTS